MKTALKLPFGTSFLSVNVPDSADILLPKPTSPARDQAGLILKALQDMPLKISERIKPGIRAGIVINDKTRPSPNELFLPLLKSWLNQRGVPDGSITFYIANGTHLPMSPSEYHRILPREIINSCNVHSHNALDNANLEKLGTTTRNTPILINSAFLSEDVKICVGDIEPHHFAGFSGGYKTAAIGLAGMETIRKNHALLKDINSRIANFTTNPLRQDIEEIGRAAGIHLCLNAILDQEHRIIHCLAEDPEEVMVKGIPLSIDVCSLLVSRQYDLVVASAGGSPKDINFYQAQKALTHAAAVCKPGGTLVLVAACPQGSGSKSYEQFMQGIHSVPEIFTRFEEIGFTIGPHKAFQIALQMQQFDVRVFSQMSKALTDLLLLNPLSDLQSLIDSTMNQGKSMAIMPHATTTIPIAQP